MEISWERLGANIRAARERKGMSAGELAARAGTTEDYVIKAEDGRKQITLLMALSFCDALGIDPDELLAGVNA